MIQKKNLTGLFTSVPQDKEFQLLKKNDITTLHL